MKQKRIWILTVLPDYFSAFTQEGVIGQVLSGKRGDLSFVVNIVNIRDYGKGNYNQVDDTPYGGGPGMILRPDILERAFLEGVINLGNYDRENWKQQLCTIFTSPRGVLWDHQQAHKLQQEFWVTADDSRDLLFLCGRYEGVDERFLEQYIEREYSIGNFVLSGGELAVMTIIDSAMRFVGRALGNRESAQSDSFESNLLDYPQFTKPVIFNGAQIPEVLTSGHHKKIEQWRKQQQIEQTKKYHPELLEGNNE